MRNGIIKGALARHDLRLVRIGNMRDGRVIITVCDTLRTENVAIEELHPA